MEELLEFVVLGVLRRQSVAVENPPGVGVDDEYRTAEGVEQNRIRGLRADAVAVEQLGSQGFGRPSLEARDSALLVEPMEEPEQTPGLEVVESGRPD